MQRKWRIDYVESERDWGRSFFSTDYDTEAEANEVFERENDAISGPAPDYYIVPMAKPYEIIIDDSGKIFKAQ